MQFFQDPIKLFDTCSILRFELRDKLTNFFSFQSHSDLPQTLIGFVFPQLFQRSGKIQELVHLFVFFHYNFFWLAGMAESTRWQVLSFLLINTWSDLWLGLDDPFQSQNPKELYRFHFQRRILVCPYTIC